MTNRALGTESVETPKEVEAALNYGDGRSRSIAIHDARAIAGQLSLDREGFVLRHHETAVTNFYDAAQVRAIYYPEVERLLRSATGAARAVAFEHDVRCAPRQGVGEVRGPVRVIHDDYTETSSPERVRLYLPEEAETLLSRRYAVINVWRSIKGTVRDTPLAVCDAQSLDAKDLIRTEQGVKHEVYLFKYRTRHRWFYFPAMEADEALLLKCYDSAADGRTRFGPHTAFTDPTTPPGTAPRESIEMRALVFHRP
jgi:hypothetical protein